ncbi:MAG TPA: DUF1794 domain-containing protein [Planctomycetes bacterium]|nr:DUF1794 domain-containing protein [Planctomycetota bacterium]
MTPTSYDPLYGPLSALIGTWTGDHGLDVAPEPDGSEESPYYETIVFEGIGDAENAEDQVLGVVRYLQIVRRKSNDEVFHDQTGYWMWDARAKTVMQSLTIPRGVCVLAGGQHSGEVDPRSPTTLRVRATLGDETFGIIQSPYMLENAKTVAFEHELIVGPDSLRYSETTHLSIYGRDFDHTDANELRRA